MTPPGGVQQPAPDVFQGKVFDKNTVRLDIQGGKHEPQTQPTLTAPASQPPVSLHHRDMPDGHDVVSNDCPMGQVAEVTDAMTQEQHCKTLQNDVQDVLESTIDVDEAIGEPETDEERMLRAELGDRFVKCVEVALLMGESGHDPTRSEQLLLQLTQLLGNKEYLLSDVLRVATLFEVDQ
jgi:hypothetical protein